MLHEFPDLVYGATKLAWLPHPNLGYFRNLVTFTNLAISQPKRSNCVADTASHDARLVRLIAVRNKTLAVWEGTLHDSQRILLGPNHPDTPTAKCGAFACQEEPQF
jgi:hypothetical protein